MELRFFVLSDNLPLFHVPILRFAFGSLLDACNGDRTDIEIIKEHAYLPD